MSMTCKCPACRGLNDERYEDHDIEMQEVEVEVTFKERVKLDIPVLEDSQEEIEHIDEIVKNIYIDVKVEDWEVI